MQKKIYLFCLGITTVCIARDSVIDHLAQTLRDLRFDPLVQKMPTTVTPISIDPTKQKQLLTNIILNNPEELAADGRFFMRESLHGFSPMQEPGELHPSALGHERDRHINATIVSDFIDFIAQDINKNVRGSELFSEPLIIPENKAYIFDIIAQLHDLKIDYNEFKSISDEYYRTHNFFIPIRYIQECDCESVHRSKPFRKEVEQRIQQQIQKGNYDKTKPLVISEFASGPLFELFMIANIAVNMGYHNLVINCIDLVYGPLVKIYQQVLGGNIQSLDKSSIKNYAILNAEQLIDNQTKKLFLELKNMPSILQPTNPQPPQPWQAGGSISLEEHQRQWDEYTKEMNNSNDYHQKLQQRYGYLKPIWQALENFKFHNTFLQFIRWFAQDKQNNISLVLYDDVNAYIKACEKNANLKSDIIVAIDYWPDDNFHFWDELRTKALKPNGYAYSVADLILQHGQPLGYFLSIGTPDSLLHYKFNFPDLSNYAKYNLNPIRKIPKHINFVTNTVQPAIPEIVPKNK